MGDGAVGASVDGDGRGRDDGPSEEGGRHDTKRPEATVPCWVLIGQGDYLACDG